MTTDDQFLDLFAIEHLVRYVHDLESVYCHVVRREVIQRSPHSLYYVTEAEWPHEAGSGVFPDFCSDQLYILPMAAVSRLMVVSLNQTRILGALDSVWVTGYLASEAGLSLADMGELFTLSPAVLVTTKMSQHEEFYTRDLIVGPLINKYTEDRGNVTMVILFLSKKFIFPPCYP